jgi:flagellar hook protein FlgE
MRAGMAGTSGAGLLARGTISFNEGSGTITGITMSNLTGTGATTQSASATLAGSFTAAATADITVENVEDLTASGTYAIAYAGGGAWTAPANLTAAGGSISSSTDSQIVIAFGTGDDITINLSEPATVAGTDIVNLAVVGNSDWTPLTTADINTDGYYEFNADFIGGAATDENIALDIGLRWNGSAFVPDSLSSTQYASSSTTVYQSANGYGAGDLEGVDVDVDGLITGVYSNGQVLPLYKIALAKFQSLQGLYKEGGNLYRETRESGPATTSLPGSNGLGNIAPNSLEQSNVDIANEFVKMITTQRGFQANSKIITVTDQMLSELINLKR